MREADYLEFSSDDDEADYAASQQQASASFVRCDSASCADGDVPWEIIYSKENVAIHPSQFASERICGRLRVSKHGSSLFLSWIPYTLDPDASESLWHMSFSRIQEKDRDLYTIKSLPLSDVRSIRRHSPVLGWHYVIIVLSTGLAFPPFYFYNGGVHEFLATLKQHIVIVRSADDENVFLVNDIRDPLQVSLSSLELPRVVSVANSSSFTNEVMIPSVDCARVNGNGTQHDGSSIASDYYRWQNQKNSDPFHGISFQLLEKFSLVTKFARETTSNIFHEFHNNKADGKRQQNNHGTLSSSGSFSDEEERNQGATPVASDPLVPDQLPVIWGQPRKPPLSSEEVYNYSLNKLSGFHSQWETFLDSEGRVLDSKSLKEGIFYGGIEHSLRKEVWKFLLGYYQYDSTYAEREYLSSIKKTEYEVIKSQWKSISAAQAKRYTKFRERKGLIDKDVVRTDRSISFYEGDDNQNVTIMHDILLTYSFYNFDLGYCQGMSDLLSPILYVMKDESESFWCFVALMERLGPNFNRDQSGMHSQLFAVCKLVELLDNPLHCYFERVDCLNYFFCFRWLLIQFKREFEYGKILYLWEVLWTHHLSEHFHLYVCVAILKRYRNKIMDEQMDFDTLLKFINELSGKIDLDRILRYAEVLCDRAGEHGAACIPPGTPPTLLNEGDTSIFQLEDEVL